ncbi:MAG: DUF4091 domain-containing protein [Ruminococcaceae bacterium]|nr:DUF4091 domain-containing protein [Oscillospiraceae bacterium]
MRIDSITTIPLSSMSTVFTDEKPKKTEKCSKLTMLSNETASFQLAFRIKETGDTGAKMKLTVESEISRYITAYVVGNVAVTKVGYGFSDEWFLRKTPGLYPDYLRKLGKNENVYSANNLWQALLFNINEDAADIPKGTYKVKVTLESCHEDKLAVSETFTVKVLGAKLPKQTLSVTNWIHYDCMSYFASCKPFSVKFWKVFRSYITLAVKNGQNMILTPAFTPPLDTAVGKERPTVQLVGVDKTDKGYKFDFSMMEKFINIALECGVEKFEHSHMFTQWGAYHAPKIVVRENGKNIKKFGWHTDAHGEEYTEFVSAYIPAVTAFLKSKGWLERFFFHVSDEPVPENRVSYSKASELMHELLGSLPSGDALSKYEFYRDGIVNIPIAKSRDIEDFIGKCDDLWLYFTGAESKNYLSNRLIGMSAERNLILGLQLYYYDIKGFLQWAFNAHHTTLCESFVNPYRSSDNNMHFVGGTSYLVYPETDGATPSIRLLYFRDIMQIVRACQLLESLTSRGFVTSIIDEIIPDFGIKCRITREQMVTVRDMINNEIEKHTK